MALAVWRLWHYRSRQYQHILQKNWVRPQAGVKLRRRADFSSACNTYHTSICNRKPIILEKLFFIKKLKTFSTSHDNCCSKPCYDPGCFPPYKILEFSFADSVATLKRRKFCLEYLSSFWMAFFFISEEDAHCTNSVVTCGDVQNAQGFIWIMAPLKILAFLKPAKLKLTVM